ncbi:MAG TPA: hypothetical protein PLQ76_03120, partial [bacterium]|nr:hypothetical protein [bacterium]
VILISPHIPREPVPVLFEIADYKGTAKQIIAMNISLEKLGLKRTRLRLWNKNAPVSFLIDFASESSGTVDYSVDFTNCSLESAKKGMELMKIIESGATILIKTTHDDKVLIEMDTRTIQGRYNYDKSIKLVEALIKINEIFGCRLKYPETLDADSIYNIQVAYYIAENGYCDFPIEGDIDISYTKEGVEIISNFDWDEPETKLDIKADSYPLMIFGEQIDLGPCRGEITGLIPSTSNEELKNMASNMKEGQNMTVKFIPKTAEPINIKYIFREN